MWRKDFHNYVTRKNSVQSVREDQVKLKINGHDFAIASYCKGSGEFNKELNFITPESFKRRAYWLIDNPQYIIVHYLDEAYKYSHNQQSVTPSQETESLFNDISIKENDLVQNFNPIINSYSNSFFSEQHEQCLNMNREQNLNGKEGCCISCQSTLNDELLSQVTNVKSNQSLASINLKQDENCINQESSIEPASSIDMIDNLMIDLDIDSLFCRQNSQQQRKMNYSPDAFFPNPSNFQHFTQVLPQQTQNNIFLSNQEDIGNLRNQLQGLQLRFSSFEKRFQNSNSPLYNQVQQQQQSKKESSLPRVSSRLTKAQGIIPIDTIYSIQQLLAMNIEITDFSPEWDYTTGGSKLLICIKPPIENLQNEIEQKFECGFGEVLVPVKFIQAGVLKCNAPPHEPGFVNLNLLFEGKVVNVKQLESQSNLFEYRQQIPKSMKRKRIRQTQPTDSTFDKDQREFKVRIVERLTFLEHRLNSHLPPSENQERSLDEFSQIDCLDNEVLETMNREFIKRVLLKTLTRMKDEILNEERLQLINGIDEQGGALLHYITAIDYYELINLLYEHGADLNVKSKDNLTPLVIAAAKGHEKSVKKLIRLGAVLWKDLDDEENSLNQNNQSLGFSSEGDSEQDSSFDSRGHISSIRSQRSFLSREGIKSRDDDALEIALQNKHHGIVEMLLRDVTLKNAVRQSDDPVSRKDSSKQQDVSSISKRIPHLENCNINLSQGAQIQRKNDHSNEPRQNEDIEPRYNLLPMNFGISNHELEKVQKIQRSVRAWLLRRQHQDIKHATNILHNEFRNKKRNNYDEKRAAIIIQRTVRAWLKIN